MKNNVPAAPCPLIRPKWKPQPVTGRRAAPALGASTATTGTTAPRARPAATSKRRIRVERERVITADDHTPAPARRNVFVREPAARRCNQSAIGRRSRALPRWIGGSFMSGEAAWAVIGAVAIVLGLAVIRGPRRHAPSDD